MAGHHIRQRIFDDLLAYIHDRLGFRFTIANREKLETKLRVMNLPEQWPDLESFHAALLSGNGEAHDLMVRTITVNHTFFFREKNQIEAAAARIRGQGIRQALIWCAASSTGEEAYSIVIQLLEQNVRDFRVVASDINPKVLHKMQQGIFHTGRLSHVSRYLLLKYFNKVDEYHWAVRPELRAYLAIKKINLVDTPRFIRPFDFIFCRNVFIYFDEFTRDRAIRTFHDNLKPGGYLYLGLTEALFEVPKGFLMETHATYRRVAED